MEKPQPWLFLQSTFPQTGADIIVHMLFVFVIHMRQQDKHEMNSYRLHRYARDSCICMYADEFTLKMFPI